MSQLEPKASGLSLEGKINQHYLLNQQKRLVEGRLAKLSQDIKLELSQRSGVLHPGETAELRVGKLKAQVQMKQRQIKVDDGVLEQLLLEKGCLDIALKQVIDHDIVEGFYIDGLITDEDLRSINGGSQIIPTLRIEEVDDDVQEYDESDSEQ